MNEGLQEVVLDAEPLLDSEPVVETYVQTVREKILEALQNAGIETPTSVEATFRSGESELISSDRHAALDRPADELVRLEFKQDAEAGLTAEQLRR